MNSIYDIVEATKKRGLDNFRRKLTGIVSGENEKQYLDRIKAAEEYVYACIKGQTLEGSIANVPLLDYRESQTTSDFSIVVPRVIDTVLREPTEPNLFMLNSLAERVDFPDSPVLSVMFPSVSAIEARRMAEGQEYTAQAAAFAEHQFQIRLWKYGTAVALSEELINASQWPLLGLYARMMKNAINRLIESGLWTTFKTAANFVFDNESSDSDYRTTGVSTDGTTWNATFGYFDLVTMFGAMIERKYEASHLLAHPLAWMVFAQDPYLQAQFLHGGQIGSRIWSTSPQFDQSVNIPFGVQYVPYYAIPYTESDTLSGAGSGLAAVRTTEIYLVDKANALWLATKGEVQMDEKEDWARDGRMMKARRFAGWSAKDGGKAIIGAKNIRVARNYEPIFSVRNV